MVLLLTSYPVQASDLIINITDVPNNNGDVRVGLFSDPRQFPEGKPLKGIVLDADTSLLEVRFIDLSPGKYAVAIFHDKNSNGRLDKNLFGIPKESYGFSNNAKGMFGVPNFEDAAILLETKDKTISIQLR